MRDLAADTGYRALLGVPLVRDGRVDRRFVSRAREPGASADARSNSSQTFADQAVIAIENVRLFDEVQARTRDLTEALQQQTATADILKVIASSPSISAGVRHGRRSAMRLLELCERGRHPL